VDDITWLGVDLSVWNVVINAVVGVGTVATAIVAVVAALSAQRIAREDQEAIRSEAYWKMELDQLAVVASFVRRGESRPVWVPTEKGNDRMRAWVDRHAVAVTAFTVVDDGTDRYRNIREALLEIAFPAGPEDARVAIAEDRHKKAHDNVELAKQHVTDRMSPHEADSVPDDAISIREARSEYDAAMNALSGARNDRDRAINEKWDARWQAAVKEVEGAQRAAAHNYGSGAPPRRRGF
jgi:hypothetical protein